MKKTFALLCFLCAFIMNATAQTWVGTWATAPQAAVKSKVLYSNTPRLHQTSGEGVIGWRGDSTEAEQHLQFSNP